MNKHFLSSSAITSNSTMTQIPSNMDIDIDMIREKPTLTSRASSRSSSISSNTLSIPYHQHIELNNDLPGIEPQEPIDSSQLSYVRKAEDLVRLATDKDSASNSQCVYNETSVLKRIPQSYSKGKGKSIDGPSSSPSENMVNTQLSYDINQVIEPDTWDGNFHSVSLHSSMEHLASDTKNIKESLHCIMKYILNKKIKNGRANDGNDFKGIDEAT